MKIFSFKTALGLLIFPVLLVLLQIYFVLTNFYDVYPNFDLLMHTVGGAYIAFVFFLILKSLQERHQLVLPKLVRVIFVISLVALTAVIWELAEFSAELISGFDFQGADINADLFFGLVGGFLGALMCEIFNTNRR